MASVFSRRVIAYVLDFFVISAIMWIVSYLISIAITNPYELHDIYKNFAYILPILILVYFIFCEKLLGSSIGKSLMHLQVRSRNGAKISWIQAIIRNLTKMYWFPIIFDWAIGKILRTDRILASITKTVVVNDFN